MTRGQRLLPDHQPLTFLRLNNSFLSRIRSVLLAINAHSVDLHVREMLRRVERRGFGVLDEELHPLLPLVVGEIRVEDFPEIMTLQEDLQLTLFTQRR